MTTSLSTVMFPEDLRSLGFAAIGVNYAPIGTGFENPARIMFLQNLTDQSLLFSWNGVDNHLLLPSTGFIVLDVTSNKSMPAGIACFRQGTRIYVKDLLTPVTSGAVFLSVFFGEVI